MKTHIIYTSYKGATKEIAHMIAERVPNSELCNLMVDPIPLMSKEDCVILGSPLTAGKIFKEMATFARHNSEILAQMRLGLFLSGLDPSREEKHFTNNFPVLLVASAKSKQFLGGIYDPAKCSFFERLAMRMVPKITAYTNTIDPAKIDLFVKELTE